MTTLLPARPATPVLTPVIDCAAYAWANCDQWPLRQLDPDFVHDFQDQLAKAAALALEQLLRLEWIDRGYDVDFRSVAAIQHRPYDHTPDDPTYWAVWQAAADKLPDGEDLARLAGGDAWDAYSDYHPVDPEPDRD